MSKTTLQGRPAPGALPDFFTVKDLAARWQCSTRHVRRTIDDEKLPEHRFGKLVRVAATVVLLYEARCAGVISGPIDTTDFSK